VELTLLFLPVQSSPAAAAAAAAATAAIAADLYSTRGVTS